LCRQGRAELELAPGIAGAGLEELRIEDGEVLVTYAGLAGGGVAATLCRGMAEGVISTTIYERGGGAALGKAMLRLPVLRKLVIGVDDTDDAERGATWSTMNEISYELELEKRCHYIGHTIVQLFPDNPHKTTNCCSTAVVLAVPPGDEASVVDTVVGMLADRCFSDECGMAVSARITASDELRTFTGAARSRLVSFDHAKDVAERSGVDLLVVTGERGCIGALAAIGAQDDPDRAVVPYGEESRDTGGE
jgi:methanogenesis imperfect marker protein 11